MLQCCRHGDCCHRSRRAPDSARHHLLRSRAAGLRAPVIHTVFPMAEAAAAHALMESSAHIGKIMLTVAS